MPFDGLTRENFATYTPDKWSSMVHNLARMKAKDAMVSLGAAVAEILGTKLSGLDRAASDEIPNITNGKKVDSQWVYWFRDSQARENLKNFLKATPLDSSTMFNIAPQDKHCTLAVVLREKELWVGFRIAPGAAVDRHNLVSKLDKSWERESLAETISALPENTLVGGANAVQPASEINAENLSKQPLGDHDPEWLVGVSMGVEEAIERGAELAQDIAQAIETLVPVYRQCAWSRDNDFIAATKQIQKEKQQERKQATSFKEGDRVRVTAGLFSGQLGEILAGGAKNKLKVRVGKMTVEVQGKDLSPA